jgi:colanic acid biosynthesis glycosyl transferase WcaI
MDRTSTAHPGPQPVSAHPPCHALARSYLVTIHDVRTTHDAQRLEPFDLFPAPRHPDTEVEAPVIGPHGGPLRVLAIGINFGPEHTGIAPYTTQLCEYLVERGASVSVFTGVPHYPGWTVDPSCRWSLRRVEKSGQFEVRRLRHYVPKKQSALRRAAYELSFAVQVALQQPREHPDVVLAVVPSLLSAVVAKRVAARAGVPLVVWVQDLMGRAAAQSGIDGGGKVAGLVAAIEKRVLQRADQVLVLNSHFADYVESIGVDPANVTLRPNWTHMAEPSGTDREQTRARLGWRPDETIVLHTGNMGLKQDLENVIAAARLADERGTNDVRFVLMGDGSQRKALQRAAEGIRAVEFLPLAPSEEYADILAAADILLVNERASSVDMSLPSKLTSYLRAGRPVISASPAAGGTAAEVKRSGGGLVVEPGQPHLLLDTVEMLTADPKSANLMGRLGRSYAVENLDARRALMALLATLGPCAAPSGRSAAAA